MPRTEYKASPSAFRRPDNGIAGVYDSGPAVTWKKEEANAADDRVQRFSFRCGAARLVLVRLVQRPPILRGRAVAAPPVRPLACLLLSAAATTTAQDAPCATALPCSLCVRRRHNPSGHEAAAAVAATASAFWGDEL